MNGPDLSLESVSAHYGDVRVLHEVSVRFAGGAVTAVLGAVGSGKSTLLRLFNRVAELQPGFRSEGVVKVGEREVQELDPSVLRQEVGMIFDRPTAFPGTVRDNVAFGLVLRGVEPAERPSRIERALRRAELWDELGEALSRPAASLSAGQRQLLCIARALVLEPRVLLLDEPTGRLHPADGARIERVVRGICPEVTVIFVTPDVAQAGRIADHVALIEGGRLIEQGPAEELFTNPSQPETQAYLSRRYS
ncbi:MAG: ATP-binding cassette domain-containing protein [Deltaproteobacteria bacterium]|nr:MAG: ATP-binding cassette domain-containing protein [Deltaproteobacteria bacterium]